VGERQQRKGGAWIMELGLRAIVRTVGVYTVMVCRWTDHILARNPLLEEDLS